MFRSRFFSFQPIVFCFAAALTFQCVSTGNLSLESAISNFNQNEKRYRIGVIDFSNSEKQTSRYDSMISDLLIVELSKNSSNVLVERSKLAELLSEHSLQSSGLLDSDRAKELGKIIPIDLILTGSYTIKKINPREDIHISGRFIHVVTGEIVYAFNTTISREGQDSFVNPSNISSLPEKNVRRIQKSRNCSKIFLRNPKSRTSSKERVRFPSKTNAERFTDSYSPALFVIKLIRRTIRHS
ncbi:curli production assembly/transport component CsgG domain protein [Leptospira santarosai str. CBC1416]|uniref:Curli production assembly/transport component CsgG domain protein n=1 Tax=Leptospira santarosai str. CBC1416 TaxID=1193059 RepID=M6VMZ7_9LEPT|nr:curli production assembly/transport component CsgG domain protein [Leptospira santarosai str. CBC1416]